tara:strand:- start:235 stop:2091 length:1857 start_codon:yes stop_codon:yes gene_type:complete
MNYDVLVIGGGHAGVEAAVASKRIGANVAIITFSSDDIGVMSCNPAMGGLGKGHLIREIDAMGGIIGVASDLSGIQFRMLNKTRGAAVQGPRAQIDREKYKKNVFNIISSENIDIIEDEVIDIMTQSDKKGNNKVNGLITASHGKIFSKSIILTTGTFLSGKIFMGDKTWNAGRLGSESSKKLAIFFKKHKFKILRLKTGTPSRLCADSINFKKCKVQHGDTNPQPFSFLTNSITNEQFPCHITYTNPKTHKMISENINKSPIFDGSIKSRGPRYCPSIEDKVERFKDKERHQIFLEPETENGKIIYPNGISTSLPAGVQLKFLRTIQGLENVNVKKYGYAVEYDCVDSQEIRNSYESYKIQGLFLAGQINGTTGYEEAASQGLLAGINAAQSLLGKKPVLIERSQGYLGVLTSDLSRGGLVEPYRMFTSRAEYRLFLRADNADERLTDLAISLGTAERERKKIWNKKKKLISKTVSLLKRLNTTPQVCKNAGLKINQDGKRRSAYEILGYKETSWNMLCKIWPQINSIKLDLNLKKQIRTNSFYDRYSKKNLAEIEELNREKSVKIQENADFENCSGLSNEVKEILTRHKPQSIGEARELPGMTPAAASILLRFIKK